MIFEQFGGVIFIKYVKIPENSEFKREIYKKYQYTNTAFVMDKVHYFYMLYRSPND